MALPGMCNYRAAATRATRRFLRSSSNARSFYAFSFRLICQIIPRKAGAGAGLSKP